MKNFITLEGGEGAGKSTIIKMLSNALHEMGFHVTCTREPGGIEIAEQIRTIILDKRNVSMDSKTEALLYAAARRQHLVEKVLPELQKGHIVLCDRFLDSSLAYQGYARGLGIEEVLTINEFAIGDCMPSLTLYLDVRPEIGLSRINQDNQREVNRLDLESLEFHSIVREGYHKLLKMFPKRIKLINAEGSLEDVFSSVLETVKDHLNNQ